MTSKISVIRVSTSTFINYLDLFVPMAKHDIDYIRFMNSVAFLDLASDTDTGVRQEALSESTVVGNVTLHVQVSHTQCNDVSVAISFQSTCKSRFCINDLGTFPYG